MVKNEVDIIETFIRYHISILDGMVILDNGSTDGTVEVINNLIKEGLPIYLLFDDNPSFDQSVMTTKMLYASLDRFHPDYILPIDVDEFLVTDSRKSIRSELENQLHPDSLFFVSWITYVPTEADNAHELNPLKRITHRRNIQHNYDEKVFIPANIALKEPITIRQGNHDIDGVQSKNIQRAKLKHINLAHIPIRSENQARSKYLVGWLTNLARDKQILFDWYYYYNILKEGRRITGNDLKDMALKYDVPNKRTNISLVKDPIYLPNSKNFELKYTPKDSIQYFKNVLNYTETLARKYSNLIKGAGLYSDNSYDNQLIQQVIKDYMLIDGWLSAREAITLYKLVRSIKNDDITICEIGSWLGKSSYVLARALDGRREGKLICIDPFDASGDESSEKIYKNIKNRLDVPLVTKFTENMRKLGVLGRIKTITGYSHEVVKKFNEPIDVLFIDGNHDYNSVLRDYQDWSKLIKKGGYIVFHDVGAGHTTGPKEVVELEIVRNPVWSNHQLIDELYIAKKVK